jgi:hypothetical protein
MKETNGDGAPLLRNDGRTLRRLRRLSKKAIAPEAA